MSKRSEYIAAFNYSDKSLIVLSATRGGVSIASFASVIGAPVGLASASFSFAFSMMTIGIIKKHNKIVLLASSKLNNIERTVPKVLIDNEISHEDFTTINYEKRNS